MACWKACPADVSFLDIPKWPRAKIVRIYRKNQPQDSVTAWCKTGDSVENKDIVLFLTVGKFDCLLGVPS